MDFTKPGLRGTQRSAGIQDGNKVPEYVSFRSKLLSKGVRELRSADLLCEAIRNDFPFGMDFIKRWLRGAQRSSESKTQHGHRVNFRSKLERQNKFRRVSQAIAFREAPSGERDSQTVSFYFVVALLFTKDVFAKKHFY